MANIPTIAIKVHSHVYYYNILRRYKNKSWTSLSYRTKQEWIKKYNSNPYVPVDVYNKFMAPSWAGASVLSSIPTVQNNKVMYKKKPLRVING
jgi:hypothetical protein